MPLDASLILGGQPVTPQNPLQTVGALAALKNQQIQQQAGQQELQQKQYAFQGMQALNQAIAKNTQPTPDGGVTINHEGVMKDLTAGGRADVANSYLTNYTDQREKIAKADEQELKNQIERHGQFASIINGVQAVPPEQRQAAYDSAIQQAKKNKLLSPEELAKVPPQVPDDATLNSLKIGSLDVKSAAEAQKNAAEAKRAAQQTQQEAELQSGKVAKQQGELADTLTKRVGQQLSTSRSVDAYQKIWNGLSDDEKAAAEKQGFTPGDQIKNARDVMNATANAGKLATTVKERADIAHQGVEEQQGAARIGLERGQLGVAQQKNAREQKIFEATGMDPANPGVMDALVDQIGNYQRKAPNLTTRNGQPTPLSIALAKKYPDYRETNFNAYQKTENAFTSGKEAGLARSIETATQHLGTLSDAGKALDTGDVKLLNSIAQTLGVQVGQSPKTTYDTIVHRVGPEITKAYIPGGGGEKERAVNESDFASSASPSQRNGAIAISAQLMKSGLNSLQDQYKRGTFGRGQQQLISPETAKALDSITGGSGSGASAIPARLSASDVGKVFKSQKTGKNIKITAVNPNDPTQFRSEPAQ